MIGVPITFPNVPTLVTVNVPSCATVFSLLNNDDGKTVAAMDMLVPGVGEMIGGSQREIRYDVLEQKMVTKLMTKKAKVL